MNGLSAVNCPTNEQLTGKFHVINGEKCPVHLSDEVIPQTPSITDESTCASRFQMIRVDRNFGRGRWKVNDYEPPESISISAIPSVNTIENEPIHIVNNLTFGNLPTKTLTAGTAEANGTSSSATLPASAAAAVAAPITFQQQRMSLNGTSNVPTPGGLLHPYTPAALANQSYLLPPHHQFGYYSFYPPPYSPYAASWAAAAALATSNPYLTPPTLPSSQQQTASQMSSTVNLNDPSRLGETDANGENASMSSASFPNATIEQLQTAQLAAIVPFLYASHHSHSPFVPPSSSSTYATIPPYHPVPSHPSIIPSHQPPQTLPIPQHIPNHTADIHSSHQVPTLISPKHDASTNLIQQSSLINTPKTKPSMVAALNGKHNDSSKPTHVNELISSTPAIFTSQPPTTTLISPITITAANAPSTSLSNIWTYATAGSPLNLSQTAQTAAVTAAAAMGLLNPDNGQNTEIANEILKGILTTPTKPDNSADIDNKISAAMDLVKMHLLSAVREEVTELRQQIRSLNEKVNSIEHENTFLRQHIPNEIYAQYIPIASSNDSSDSTTTVVPSNVFSSSSQPIPVTSLSSIPSSLVQQSTFSTYNLQQPLSTIHLPAT